MIDIMDYLIGNYLPTLKIFQVSSRQGYDLCGTELFLFNLSLNIANYFTNRKEHKNSFLVQLFSELYFTSMKLVFIGTVDMIIDLSI